MRDARWLLLPLLALTALLYLPGLQGPFYFDDYAHVTKNRQVHITDLSPASLYQAWHSSLADFPGSRPLAQLTFGIDHALSGLDAFAFKATNLAIHLLAGLLVYALTRQLTRALAHSGGRDPALDNPWPALLTAALWLLHPLNLTPVLYVVQRMTSLSALFVLVGLWCHVSGRLQMAAGRNRGLWLALAGLPVAGIGVLAKESAALYPLLVLVLEWTLLRELLAPRRRLLVGLVAGLPLLIGTLYLLSHLHLIDYVGRDFTLEQRLLTESRVLWIYLRMLLVPDLATLGFYHDDIPISLALLSPWTTLPAVLSWLLLIPLALWQARRFPVLNFALLFFLAAHAMESTIFPLELVFEHRNYLPILGPLFAAAWLLTGQPTPQFRRLLGIGSLLVLLVLAALTALRAGDWSEHNRLVFSEVSHHPDSPRANFRTAQILMDQLGRNGDQAKIYLATRYHLDRVRELAPDNLNALFGRIFLELFVARTPDPAIIDTLILQLRTGPVDPTKLAIGQLTYLVRWQSTAGVRKLPHAEALAILQAVVDNPKLGAYGKAGALSALRAYHQQALNDPQAALPYARAAVSTWPGRWDYHYRLILLLLELGQHGEATEAFERAERLPSAELNPDQANKLRAMLASTGSPSAPHDDRRQ